MTYASKLTLTGARRQLAEVQRRAFALSHASGVLAFDAATNAPIANRLARSRTLSVLGEAELDLVSSAEGIRLLDYLADHADELTEQERRTAYLLRRSGEMLRHVNREEYLSYRKLVNEVSGAWAAARENSNFSEAEPWLERLIYAARRLAEQTAPELSPTLRVLARPERGGLDGGALHALFR